MGGSSSDKTSGVFLAERLEVRLKLNDLEELQKEFAVRFSFDYFST